VDVLDVYGGIEREKGARSFLIGVHDMFYSLRAEMGRASASWGIPENLENLRSFRPLHCVRHHMMLPSPNNRKK